jgi:hypothetical protein
MWTTSFRSIVISDHLAMTFDFERQFGRYLTLFAAREFDERLVDHSNLDRHRAFLRQCASAENSSTAVMDLFQRRYVFMQSLI